MEHCSRAYAELPLPEHPRSWAEIDLEALCSNYCALCRSLRQGTMPIAVVKADAYGHGAAACAKALWKAGCSYFAVSCLEEGIALRRALLGQAANILILGYTDPTLATVLAKENLIQTLLSRDYAAALCHAAKKAGVRIRVHYALDTGMNRLGFLARNAAEVEQTTAELLQFAQQDSFCSEGLFTHFACANEPENQMTDLQVERFLSVRKQMLAQGVRLFCHACNSAATLTRPQDHMDGVRLGIALWGVSPCRQTATVLKPVMRLCTRVVHLHRVHPGDKIGYGGAFCAARESLIATLPIGYADGWSRAYQGATVTLQTASDVYRVPLIGRICMDQCMADVTDTSARVGDQIILFGERLEYLPALADRAGTIPYESLCLISSRVPRVYIE